PVCASSPASPSSRYRVELVRMSGDSGLGLESRLLEWWSPGEEGVIQFGSPANSCKEVGSGRFPTSAVRALAPPVYPAGYLRRVGHVGGPAVRGCDDLTGGGPLEPFVSATGNSGGRGLDPSADPVVGPLWEVGRLHFAVATYISHLFLHGSAKNESESERVPFPFPFPLHD
ncbi:hypothetical protein B296_00058869, partial [Ensete ventricosum]